MRQRQLFRALVFPLPLQALAGVIVIALAVLCFFAGIVIYLVYLLFSSIHL